MQRLHELPFPCNGLSLGDLDITVREGYELTIRRTRWRSDVIVLVAISV